MQPSFDLFCAKAQEVVEHTLHTDQDNILMLSEMYESPLDDSFLQSILMTFGDEDVVGADMHTKTIDDKQESHMDTRLCKSRVRNKLCAQQSREADRVYIDRMLVELADLSDTIRMYVAYIAQLKQHGACGEQSPDFEQIFATIKHKQDEILETDKQTSIPKLLGMSTKERNRIHAQKSRKKKEMYVESLVKQRDDLWSTIREVKQHTTALEACSAVLNHFDETSNCLLGLTQARDVLFQRTCSHERQYEELRSRQCFRVKHRLHFKQIMH